MDVRLCLEYGSAANETDKEPGSGAASMNSLFSLSDSFTLSSSWGRGLAATQSGQFLQRWPGTEEGPVPGSVLQALHLFYRSQWCSPLGRFHRHLVRSTRAALVAAPHNSAAPCSGRISSDVWWMARFFRSCLSGRRNGDRQAQQDLQTCCVALCRFSTVAAPVVRSCWIYITVRSPTHRGR